ncbi:MAG TPA: serine protease [Casimicrobiaceae bacterium]|nr:serine protease [Casimicrobiaceae bacterium]
MRILRPSAALAVAALGAIMAALSSIGDAWAASRITAVPPAEYRPNELPPSTTLLTTSSTTSHRVVLGSPTAGERAVMATKNERVDRLVGSPNPGKHRPLAIGFPRKLPEASQKIALANLRWEPRDEETRVARIEIVSPGAAALRVALVMGSAHPDLALTFAGNGERAVVAGPIPANRIAETVTRDGVFWTPVLEGDTAIIEVAALAGASFSDLSVDIGPISHLVVAGSALHTVDAKRVSDIGRAGSCNIDIACVEPSAALTQTANSVGKLVFNDRNGSTYACSGTMLNDSTQSFTPYVFSANHCFDEAFLASTLNVYWFFRAQVCGRRTPPPFALQTGGAMLLARSEDYDWALLRMNTAPPTGVFFAAWRAEPIPNGAVVTALHHPEGDLAKFTQGTKLGDQAVLGHLDGYKVQWSQGTTEGGSSGSGLFTFVSAGGYYELRGGLQGGDAFCSNPTGFDYYSKLETMLPVTRQYLTPDADAGTQVVAVEFYNRGLDHYFITTDANEINLLDTGVLRGWERTGIRFLAHSAPVPGTNPVCRFYLRPEVGDSHFYSADPAECDRVQAKFGASWIYESPSVFYIALPNPTTGACPTGFRPIWRFFNTATTNHRYTPDVRIRNALHFDRRWVAEGYGPDAVIMCSPVG